MKLRKFFTLTFALAVSFTSVTAKDKEITMNQAVMQVYNKLLQQDPKDYQTYFYRANEYYKHNLYSQALEDINSAISYTPESNKDLLLQEYSLRANIYLILNKNEDALSDITKAYALSPNDYVTCYQKANIELETENYPQAIQSFKKLQRLNPRSTEALVGLARVAVKQSNIGLANDYINQAVEFDKTNSNIYVKRASIRKDINNNSGAVEDLLVAIGLDNNNSTAYKKLNEIANSDYSAVIAGISNVISQVPDKGMYYYIRAYIAMDHYHFVSALADYKFILKQNFYNYDGIYRSIAVCYLNMGKYEDALQEIDHAIAMTDSNTKSYQVKAQILLALGKNGEALSILENLIDKNYQNEDVYTLKGIALMNEGKYIDASSSFGEASIHTPSSPQPYLLRAYTLEKYLSSEEPAQKFYTRALNADTDSTSIYSLRCFALYKTGEKEKADEWLNNILSGNDNDGSVNYYAACYYALTGNTEKALQCVQTSLSKGFGSYYLWNDYSVGDVNVAPLRQNTQFSQLLQKYGSLFSE